MMAKLTAFLMGIYFCIAEYGRSGNWISAASFAAMLATFFVLGSASEKKKEQSK